MTNSTATTEPIKSDPTFPPPAGRNTDVGRRRLTDLGNAERLADRAAGRLLYVRGPGWYAWDGARWKRAIEGEEVREAKAMVRSIYGEAADLNRAASRSFDEARREEAAALAKRLGSWAHASEASAKIRAALDLARSEVPLVASPSSLDAHPLSLNVVNGILDLETITLRPHDPAQRHTRVANASFDPGARSDRWERFLAETLPSEQVRAYVQKAVGLSLVGRFSEHLFIPWGSGRNGKSTFLWAVRHALGDYGMEAAPDLLVDSGRARSAGDLSAAASLMGRRFVTTIETGENKRLDEPLVKQLTGEHTLSSKFMAQDFFEFENQTSIWLATNHKPQIVGSDTAIWERIHLIPFETYVPPGSRNPNLGEELEADHDAILAWAVEGLRLYRTDGLVPPADVAAATNEYKSEMDPMREWLDSCCDLGDAGTATPSRYVGKSYADHCRNVGVKPLPARDFKKRMEARGFKKKSVRIDGTPTNCWVGLDVDDAYQFRYLERVMGYTIS